jgi:hypothetical protein
MTNDANIWHFYGSADCLKTYISILYCCNCWYNYECIFVIAPWGTLIGIKKYCIVLYCIVLFIELFIYIFLIVHWLMIDYCLVFISIKITYFLTYYVDVTYISMKYVFLFYF